MSKNEQDFIKELEKRAVEQRKLVATEILPQWARVLGEWMAIHPWRVIAPLSAMAYGLWRMAYGGQAREVILAIFGGFR